MDTLLCDEVSEAIDHFHPQISALSALPQLEDLLWLANQLHLDIYRILDDLEGGATLSQLKEGVKSEGRKQYVGKEKIQS